MTVRKDKFTSGQVADITGVTINDIQNWCKRGYIMGEAVPEGGGSQGRHRKFSFEALLVIAFVKALIDAGMRDLVGAFRAASQFAYATNSAQRLPGLPFGQQGSRTLIVAGSDWSRAIAVRPGESAFDLFLALSGEEDGKRQIGGVWIDATAVFEKTVRRIGGDPEAEMLRAYGPR